MNRFVVLKIVLAFDLYIKISDDSGKYQVEARPNFEGRSLGGIFESAEGLPFIDQVHNFRSTEASFLYDDDNTKSRSKIKLRPKSKKLSTEELRTKHRSTKKKRKRNRKKMASIKNEKNQTGFKGKKRKPFDITVHIKVNDHE